jgi:hypothetical protein
MYLHHARYQSDLWLLLAIKPDYLWKINTLFCPINAASGSGAYIKEGFDALNSMYAPRVVDIKGREYTRDNLPKNIPTCIQAEVQVYESIALNDVMVILTDASVDNITKIRNAGWQRRIGNYKF